MNSDAMDWTDSYGWYFDCHPARKVLRSSAALTAESFPTASYVLEFSWKEILR